MLNSRPLTYIYPEVTDNPLTPSHLVIGRRLATLPDKAQLSDDEEPVSKVQRRALYLSKLLEHFWKCWKNEHLVGLREFHRCCPKGGQDRRIKTGDVVLVLEDTSRSNWRLGEVVEVIESSDGYERGALLRVTNKKGKHSRIRRPIQKLLPLEVNTGNTPVQGQVGDVQEPNPRSETSRPPRRAAAATADVIRRLVDQQ